MFGLDRRLKFEFEKWTFSEVHCKVTWNPSNLLMFFCVVFDSNCLCHTSVWCIFWNNFKTLCNRKQSDFLKKKNSKNNCEVLQNPRKSEMSAEPQHSGPVIPGTGRQQLVCTRKVLSESKSGVVAVTFWTANVLSVIQKLLNRPCLSVLCIGFSLSCSLFHASEGTAAWSHSGTSWGWSQQQAPSFTAHTDPELCVHPNGFDRTRKGVQGERDHVERIVINSTLRVRPRQVFALVAK